MKPSPAVQTGVLFGTHLLVAVCIGWLSGHPRVRRRLDDAPALSTAWLVGGAALPDVVDKPLGALRVVDVYQSVGHSALLAPLAIAVATRNRRRGLAAAVGWGSHLALDALHVVLNGRANDALFLAWPVLTRSSPLAIPPGEFALYYVGSPSFLLEVALWLTALVVALRSRFGGGPGRRSDR
ncbi:metal-dependent hydrolase [Halorubrum sp. AD140]|uniref:metal-dependent hydrolase n=1 Tax=Halorubrum sp. AD140 TaxID=3050073 RepID=UPI002ACCFCF7|nr:metal-dependent hydrolase [Halorubrum sp. AD140]MDZ5810894.1 metal-dependent hydrolase [Halorubrum sp. AD140]